MYVNDTWQPESDGYARIIYNNGEYYEGYHENGMRHGLGKYVFTDGEIEAGFHRNNDYVEEAELK